MYTAAEYPAGYQIPKEAGYPKPTSLIIYIIRFMFQENDRFACVERSGGLGGHHQGGTGDPRLTVQHGVRQHPAEAGTVLW